MMRHRVPESISTVLLLVIFLICSLTEKASAQNFSNGFNFYLPPYDTGSTRFLPQFPKIPLTDQDFVSIDPQGHFSVRGAPIRFFGVNETLSNMNPADLPSIIGRIRKMGFNLLRCIHIDVPSDVCIFDAYPSTDTRHLNAQRRDFLEYTLSLLKENGIYAYMGLLGYRRFTEADGVQGADSIALNVGLSSAVIASCFDPQLIFLQKEYARQLLTHLNPYTGDSLINDPVMAALEIQNEDYLYTLWRWGKIQSMSSGGALISRHVRMLDSLWNVYLLKKYHTPVALGVAWSRSAEDQIQNGSFETGNINTDWRLDLASPGTACATMSLDAENPISGTNCARLDVQKVDEENWHIVFRQNDLSIIKDSVYVIQFFARSNEAHSISVDIWGDTQYTCYPCTITSEWQAFGFIFRAPESCMGQVKMNFYLGNPGNTGTYWFDDIMMYKSGGKGLEPDESLSDSSVKRIAYHDCPYYTEQRVRDISEFYISLQRNFFSEMSRYLKDTLGVRVPIVGTNMNSYLGDLVMESGCDFVDTHTYYGNTSDDNMILSQNGGAIGWTMVRGPMKNKPFTVSEFQYTWPNRYQSESPLVMSAYSSFHDIDGFIYFNYSEDPWKYADLETDIIGGYFDGNFRGNFEINRNSAMMALMPSCAYAYRYGLISKAKQTVYLNYCKDDYLLFPKIDTWWPNDPEPFRRTIALKHAVRTDSFESTTRIDYASISARAGWSPYVSDTHELTWNTNGLLSVGSGRFAGFTGLLNNFVNSSAGPMTIKAASGFGTLTWLSLTEDSLKKAERSLLTISTRAQNTGMVWSNGEVFENNFGTSPTQIEPLRITLLLSVEADSIRVHPLDTLGCETNGYQTYYPWPNLPNPPSNIHHPSNFPSRPTAFLVDIDQSQSKTMWYGVERFKNNRKPILNSRIPNKLSMVCQDNPQTFSVDVTSPMRLPVRYQWKVNGITKQTSARSSYTVIFRDQYNKPMSVTVVFSVSSPFGVLKDSTTWNFKLAGKIVVDGEKDDFFNTLTGPGDGYLQIRSYAFNENGRPSDDNDLSAKVWTAWDDQWFYLYEEVKDNMLSGNDQWVWNEDCLELKIDPQPTDAESNSIWEARLTALGIEEPGVVAADSLNDLLNSKKQWKRVRTDDGYKLELAIKWTAIQSGTETITPAVGKVFGLAINQHDNDGNGRKATIQWAAVMSDEVYNTPKYLGTVKFLDHNKLQFIPTNNMTSVTNPIPYDGSQIITSPD